MEEKKTIKISLSTFFLLLALVAIVVMAIFMYKFYDDKKNADEKSANLENQLSNLNETVKALNNKISNTNNTTDASNSDNTATNQTVAFTDTEVKLALSKFLEVYAESNCDGLFGYLEEHGLLKNVPYDYIPSENGVTTNVKFSDYKEAMLNYVSEDLFNKSWTDAQFFYENSDGYLTKALGGGSLRNYTIIDISKINNNIYSAKVSSTVVDDSQIPSTNETFTFSVTSYNGKCVIDSFENASN